MMSREVIQDFLNVSGIVGVALTNRRMRPCFYGLDNKLDARQQVALAQGIQQVIDNVPEGFERFEFFFSNNTIFIYKLTHGLVLLVLTDQDLVIKNYQVMLERVWDVVETDTYNAIATFKLLLGNVTQPSLPSQAFRPDMGDRRKESPSERLEIAEEQTILQIPKKEIQVTKPVEPPSPSIAAKEFRMDDLLVVMNKLSHFTTQYLGKVVVANYWKSSRPSTLWLQDFHVDRNAQISCPFPPNSICTPDQHRQLREWTETYVQRCKQVIRNFDSMIAQDCPDVGARELLATVYKT